MCYGCSELGCNVTAGTCKCPPQFVQVTSQWSPTAEYCIPKQLICGDKCKPYGSNYGLPSYHDTAQNMNCAYTEAAPKIDRWYYKGTEDNKFYEWRRSDVDSKHSECIGIWDMHEWKYVPRDSP